MVLGKLRDVDETFNTLFNLNEGPERNQLGDLTMHDLVDLTILKHLLPRIFLSLLEAQRDTLPLAIDVEYPHLDLLADGQNLRRMVHMTPRELRDMDEAVDAVEIDKSTEVNDIGDQAGNQVAYVHTVEDLLPRSTPLLFEHRPATEHDIVAEAIELDHPALEGLAEELVEFGHPAYIDQGRRQEPAHAQIQYEATLDHFDDVTRNRRALFGRLLDTLPRPLEPGALAREYEPAVGVFFREHQRVHDIADRDLFRRIDRLPDRQLVGWDDPLALVPDVDKDLVLIDSHNSPCDDIPLFEGHDRGVVVGNELPIHLHHEFVSAL